VIPPMVVSKCTRASMLASLFLGSRPSVHQQLVACSQDIPSLFRPVMPWQGLVVTWLSFVSSPCINTSFSVAQYDTAFVSPVVTLQHVQLVGATHLLSILIFMSAALALFCRVPCISPNHRQCMLIVCLPSSRPYCMYP
jgi:hypothetical protein